jgi:glyoxylase-like metal-dependent hydrolase (beta-lactamase superfamily II)
VVADPGMVTDRALIVEGLAETGVAPTQVTHIFISHHHPHHTVNIALFPNAEVVDGWASNTEDIAKALTGHYRLEHVFALKQALALYDASTDRRPFSALASLLRIANRHFL